MTGRAAGRIAVVTGAARGIGQAIARRLAEDGHALALADIGDLAETAGMVAAARAQVHAATCDVSSEGDLRAFAEGVQARYGRADVLVNNAGVYPLSEFEAITLAEWRRVMAINLEPLLVLTQAFVGGMKSRGWGRVINVASNSLHMAASQLTHYQASKGGVIGFTRGLAADLGPHGITVNCISPALSRTPGTAGFPEAMIQAVAANQCIKRVAVASDYEGVVSFLASDDSALLTAQELIVDGGLGR